jgi:excinuclease ABC subunit B
MITTLTVKMAEDLTEYLKHLNLKVCYLHHENKPIERTEIIYDFRRGKYDVLVGINLLREGLDLPEVSLICIIDADKEGFLRSKRALIQIVGRAARNKNGKVIMYADKVTDSMADAINETNRRRSTQEKYNIDNNITPTTIVKPLKKPISMIEKIDDKIETLAEYKKLRGPKKDKVIRQLTKDMKEAASKFDFETAAEIRDMIKAIKNEE